MTTFTQLNTRLKKCSKWLVIVFGLQKCLVECAILCDKSEVILTTTIVTTTTTDTSTTIAGTTTVKTITASEITSFLNDEEIIPVIATKTHTYLDILRARKKLRKDDISGNLKISKNLTYCIVTSRSTS